jgi:hypothetical protein
LSNHDYGDSKEDVIQVGVRVRLGLRLGIGGC